MSIKQIYANRFGNELSENQVRTQGDFLIKFYDNEILTKIETYSKGTLVGTSHNLQSSDSIPSILESNPNASFQVETQNGNYSLAECLLYQNKVLVGKQIFLTRSSDDNMICRHLFDPLSNAIVHNRTIKKYYNVNGDELYEFEYKADGSCFYINNLQPYGDNVYAADIGVDPDLDFTWQGFEYYQFSEPLIPTVI